MPQNKLIVIGFEMNAYAQLKGRGWQSLFAYMVRTKKISL